MPLHALVSLHQTLASCAHNFKRLHSLQFCTLQSTKTSPPPFKQHVNIRVNFWGMMCHGWTPRCHSFWLGQRQTLMYLSLMWLELMGLGFCLVTFLQDSFLSMSPGLMQWWWAASISFCPPARKRAQQLPHQSQHGAGDARRAAPRQGAELLSRPGGGGLQRRAGTYEELRAGKELATTKRWAAGQGCGGVNAEYSGCFIRRQSFPALKACRKLEKSGMEMLMQSLRGLPVGGEEELVGSLLVWFVVYFSSFL